MSKILIIDDQGIIREALQAVLSDLGYEVKTAEDGVVGIDIYKGFQPDIVLLDRDMPRMTGSEVLQRLRRVDPRARVIILSGHTSDEEKYRRLGAKCFLSKGIGMSELHAAIQQQLK